jgi:DNA polymerase-3 subunit delta'
VTLFEDVVGQDRAVAQLRSSARAPVHAYLFVGPPGSGKRAAARSFAAALLCADGGDGTCRDCTLALVEHHPDLSVVEREGPFITVEQARTISRIAARTPVEGLRKVIVLDDFHLVKDAAPALLKTIEEPPPSTVFVVLAEHVPAELVTIASRCVRVDFGAVPDDLVVAALVASGVDEPAAREVAVAASGRLDRARLLASDPGFATRRDVWRNVPARLDGTGAAVAVVAAELVELIGSAGLEALEARQRAEATALEERVKASGERGSGRKQLEERHKRERRRLRLDELRFGLATLESRYRDRMQAAASPREMVEAIRAIEATAESLQRNPTEGLLLQALLLRLPPLEGVTYSTTAPG